MAVTIKEFRIPMSPQEACSYVQQSTDRLGIFLDLDRMSELVAILSLKASDALREAREIAGFNLSLRDKNSVINQLIAHGAHITDFQVNWRKKEVVYLNSDAKSNVMENRHVDETGRRILTLYNEFTTYNRNISTIRTLMDYPRSMLLSHDKHRMVKVNPKWTILSTSRIGTSEPNIQGIPRDLGDIYTYPAGYMLVRADSKQIEPRINFSHFIRDELIIKLITHYDDAYFGLLHYCTASDAQVALWRKDFAENFIPINITQEMEKNRQTIKTLTNAGSYGSSNLTKVDSSLAASFEKRIKNHPARLSMERKVEEAVNRGVTTFYGAFGTSVTPETKDNYVPGTEAYRKHMIRCGINNPVQVTASELMICGMAAARQILSQAHDSYLTYYKHDENCFLIADKDADSGIIEKLAETTSYNVQGWIPIGSDKLVGKKKPVFDSYL